MDLLGKTILITRASTQSDELRQALSALGARVLECPAIQIVPPDDWTDVDRAIRDMDSYHWLLFTSANAVEHFMRRVEAAGTRVSVPIAVVGPATARKLHDWNLSASLAPESYRAEGLLKTFPDDLSAVRILFPRAESAREILPDELRRRGALVDVLTVYRTVKADGLSELFRLFKESNIDCVVFTSPSTIRFIAEALEDEFEPLMKTLAVAVIGPVTRDAAESLGLKVTIQPEHATVSDLVQSIVQNFRR